jgi:hypothetical protein
LINSRAGAVVRGLHCNGRGRAGPTDAFTRFKTNPCRPIITLRDYRMWKKGWSTPAADRSTGSRLGHQRAGAPLSQPPFKSAIIGASNRIDKRQTARDSSLKSRNPKIEVRNAVMKIKSVGDSRLNHLIVCMRCWGESCVPALSFVQVLLAVEAGTSNVPASCVRIRIILAGCIFRLSSPLPKNEHEVFQ